MVLYMDGRRMPAISKVPPSLHKMFHLHRCHDGILVTSKGVHHRITMGREEERFQSTQEIERLTLQRYVLTRELDTVKGTSQFNMLD